MSIIAILIKALQFIQRQLLKSDILNAIDNHPKDIIAIVSSDGKLIYGNKQLRKTWAMYGIPPGEISGELPEHETHEMVLAVAEQVVATGEPVRQVVEYDGDTYDLIVGSFEDGMIFSARPLEETPAPTGDFPLGVAFDPHTGMVTRVNRNGNGSLVESTLFRIGDGGILVFDKNAREEVLFGWETLQNMAQLAS